VPLTPLWNGRGARALMGGELYSGKSQDHRQQSRHQAQTTTFHSESAPTRLLHSPRSRSPTTGTSLP